MRRIKWEISTGYCGADYEGEFEVDDDATDDEIQDYVEDELWNRISIGWEEVKE